MKLKRRQLPFRWILPSAQLILCIAILWPIHGHLVSSLRNAIDAYQARGIPLRDSPKYMHDAYPGLPPNFTEQQFIQAIEKSVTLDRNTATRLWSVELLNLPVTFVELPYAIATHDKKEWIPKGMQMEDWRAITWPLLGIFIWWIAGRGIEALIAVFRAVAQPPLSYVEIVVGALFILIGVVVIVPGGIPNEEIPRTIECLCGVMWACLGAAIIFAKVAQWRITRKRVKEPTPNFLV